jgi:hypothetical protein
LQDVLLDDLPRIDEHDIVVAAGADDVWHAAMEVLGTSSSSPWAKTFVRLLGCRPSAASAWQAAAAGSSVPGFTIVDTDCPQLLVLAGRHRFSRYGVVLRIEPVPGGSRCRLESRAVFPGPHGSLYRRAVLGSGAHVVALRRLLRHIRRTAEQRSAA